MHEVPYPKYEDRDAKCPICGSYVSWLERIPPTAVCPKDGDLNRSQFLPSQDEHGE